MEDILLFFSFNFLTWLAQCKLLNCHWHHGSLKPWPSVIAILLNTACCLVRNKRLLESLTLISECSAHIYTLSIYNSLARNVHVTLQTRKWVIKCNSLVISPISQPMCTSCVAFIFPSWINFEFSDMGYKC